MHYRSYKYQAGGDEIEIKKKEDAFG
jgi:hypothetical protein